jgi:hypothetical protein
MIGDDNVLGRNRAVVADDQLKSGRLTNLDFGRCEFLNGDRRLLRALKLALGGGGQGGPRTGEIGG